MADEPISSLAQRTLPLPSKGSATTSPTQGSYQDEIEILDATDGSMSPATGTNRRIVVGDFLFGFIQAGAGISITEPLTDTNPGIVITNTSTGAVASVFTRTGSVVASSGDYTVAQVTGAAPLASPAFTGTVTLPVGLTGIVKASSGVVSTATAGTDYLTPSGSGASLTGITGGQITGNISGNAASITGSITTSQVSNLSSWAGSTSITTLGTIATGTVPQANVSGLTTALGLLAPLASPTFTGAVTLPAGTVTLSEHANLAASSLMGNPTGSPAAPSAVTLGANLTFSGSTLVGSSGGSTNVVYASKISGIHLDGSTDDTSAIQAVLDTAGGTKPLRLVMDGISAINTLYVYTGQHIDGIPGLGGFRKLPNPSSNGLMAITNKHWVLGTTTPGGSDNHITLTNLYIDGNRRNGGGGPVFPNGGFPYCNASYYVVPTVGCTG